MSRDEESLVAIVNAARRIGGFTVGSERADFFADVKTNLAVLYLLLIVGEAARRLSREFRGEHPAIEWSEIVAMRNRLIHNFDRVDLDVVWDTIEIDLPRLLAYLEPLLPLNG
jgi:uncharacterized protein with HEPN domain